MRAPFATRVDQDALIVSFLAPARALSWAVLNGGYCHADHVINHHVSGDDRWFAPNRTDGWKNPLRDWDFKARSSQWPLP
jgi:adenosylcobinamide amidohydrolase